MARANKDGHYINANIQKELYDAIVKHCEETGLNKTTAIEHAIKYYLEQYEKTKRI